MRERVDLSFTNVSNWSFPISLKTATATFMASLRISFFWWCTCMCVINCASQRMRPVKHLLRANQHYTGELVDRKDTFSMSILWSNSLKKKTCKIVSYLITVVLLVFERKLTFGVAKASTASAVRPDCAAFNVIDFTKKWTTSSLPERMQQGNWNQE